MNAHDMNAHEWTSHIVDLVRREHAALADLLLAIAEFDGLKMYRRLGYRSLFDFLHREVGLSRGSAYYRQVGARVVQRFPETVDPIRDGRLCLTGVIELAKVVTDKNREEVIPRFFHRSRQEAKQVVVEMRPIEHAPTRTVVTTAVVQPVEPDPTHPGGVSPSNGLDGANGGRTEAARPGQGTRTTIEPLSRTSSRLHITVSQEFLVLLKRAKAGEAHVRPSATDEEVLRTGLELLLRQQEKRKASVPAKVKREVRARDGARCQWPTHDGGTCGATAMLEVDHVVPRGKGGASTAENCRILCRAHNLEAARLAYGNSLVERYVSNARRRRDPVVREPCEAYYVDRAASARRPIRASSATTATVATSPPHCSAWPAGPTAGRRLTPSSAPNVAPAHAQAKVMGAIPTSDAPAKAPTPIRLAESA